MQVEESEKKYGKRWDKWTEEEIMEHVSLLEMSDLNVPLNLRYIAEHKDRLPDSTRLVMAAFMARHEENMAKTQPTRKDYLDQLGLDTK